MPFNNNSYKFLLLPLEHTDFLSMSAQADRDLEVLEPGGRHRPQRCRQTDRKVGEAVAHVQADSPGKAKGHRGRPSAAFLAPRPPEGTS
jgi:hypothetical protein